MSRFDAWVPWLFLAFWSAGYSVAKLALEYTTPINLLAFRFAGTVLALTPIVLLLRLPLLLLRLCVWWLLVSLWVCVLL